MQTAVLFAGSVFCTGLGVGQEVGVGVGVLVGVGVGVLVGVGVGVGVLVTCGQASQLVLQVRSTFKSLPEAV